MAYAKIVELDGENMNSDEDMDAHEIGVYYNTADLVFGFAIDYYDDQTNSDATAHVNGTYDRDWWRIKAYGDIKFGNWYVESEIAYDTGDWHEFDADGIDDVDLDALVFMLDVGGKFGNLDAGLMYFYASGDDEDEAAWAHGEFLAVRKP